MGWAGPFLKPPVPYLLLGRLLSLTISAGIFLAPFHRVGDNPTLAIERDMKLMGCAKISDLNRNHLRKRG